MVGVHLDHIGHKLWQRAVAVQYRDTSCCRDEPRGRFRCANNLPPSYCRGYTMDSESGKLTLASAGYRKRLCNDLAGLNASIRWLRRAARIHDLPKVTRRYATKDHRHREGVMRLLSRAGVLLF